MPVSRAACIVGDERGCIPDAGPCRAPGCILRREDTSDVHTGPSDPSVPSDPFVPGVRIGSSVEALVVAYTMAGRRVGRSPDRWVSS